MGYANIFRLFSLFLIFIGFGCQSQNQEIEIQRELVLDPTTFKNSPDSFAVEIVVQSGDTFNYEFNSPTFSESHVVYLPKASTVVPKIHVQAIRGNNPVALLSGSLKSNESIELLQWKQYLIKNIPQFITLENGDATPLQNLCTQYTSDDALPLHSCHWDANVDGVWDFHDTLSNEEKNSFRIDSLAESKLIKMKFLFEDSVYIIKNIRYSSRSYLTDIRDGNKYRIAKIGGLDWMVENMRFTKISDSVYNIVANIDSNKSAVYYNGSIANEICPMGWTLPYNSQWNKLYDFADQYGVAAKVLKSRDGWIYDYENLDTLGFTAKAYGYWIVDKFQNKGKSAAFWAAATSANQRFSHIINDASISIKWIDKSYFLSVRCIQSGV